MLINLIIVFFVGLIIYQSWCKEPLLEGLDGQALSDHDELVRLKALIEAEYRPLIVNSEGKPTNILSRIAKLEGDVEMLGKRLQSNTTAQAADLKEPKINGE